MSDEERLREKVKARREWLAMPFHEQFKRYYEALDRIKGLEAERNELKAGLLRCKNSSEGLVSAKDAKNLRLEAENKQLRSIALLPEFLQTLRKEAEPADHPDMQKVRATILHFTQVVTDQDNDLRLENKRLREALENCLRFLTDVGHGDLVCSIDARSALGKAEDPQ